MIKHPLISKREYHKDYTLSNLYYDKELICYTIELPWKNNQKSISCIPPGLYEMKPFSSEDHPDCFYLENKDLNVTKHGPSIRTEILLHVANFVSDILGCVGPGLERQQQLDIGWVNHSRKAMDKLRDLIKSENITHYLIEV